MDKITITKTDIDTGNVELPDGYVFNRVKTKDEKLAEIDREISRLTADTASKPTFEELESHNSIGLIHPYYEAMRRINELFKEKDIILN